MTCYVLLFIHLPNFSSIRELSYNVNTFCMKALKFTAGLKVKSQSFVEPRAERIFSL